MISIITTDITISIICLISFTIIISITIVNYLHRCYNHSPYCDYKYLRFPVIIVVAVIS